MKEMWNKRYAGDEYVYGVHPNIFLKKRQMLWKWEEYLCRPKEKEGIAKTRFNSKEL